MLTQVLDKDPKQEETLLEIPAFSISTRRRRKDALEHFRRAYEVSPSNIRGLLGESKALLMDGQADKSVDLIRQATVKTPTFQLQRELGNAQMAARQFDAAIGTYKSLADGTSDTKIKGDLYSRIGESYRFRGDYSKSIEYMEMATKALPDNARGRHSISRFFTTRAERSPARAHLLRKGPEDRSEQPAGAEQPCLSDHGNERRSESGDDLRL